MGLRRAKQAGEWFQSRNVTAEFVIDEGPTLTHGIISGIERPVGLIGVLEKGYATVRMRATALLEGHSMMPPARSLIVQPSAAIGRLEEQGFHHRLQGTARRMLSTLAPQMRWPQRIIMGHLWLFAPLAAKALSRMDATRAMLGTTVAATTIKAGPGKSAYCFWRDGEFRHAAGSSRHWSRYRSAESRNSNRTWPSRKYNDSCLQGEYGVNSAYRPNCRNCTWSVCRPFGFDLVRTDCSQRLPLFTVATSPGRSATASRHR